LKLRISGGAGIPPHSAGRQKSAEFTRKREQCLQSRHLWCYMALWALRCSGLFLRTLLWSFSLLLHFYSSTLLWSFSTSTLLRFSTSTFLLFSTSLLLGCDTSSKSFVQDSWISVSHSAHFARDSELLGQESHVKSGTKELRLLIKDRRTEFRGHWILTTHGSTILSDSVTQNPRFSATMVKNF